MEDLKRDKTEMTPEVNLSLGGKLLIQGRSFPEDVGAFFDPISEWIESYTEQAAESTELKVFFEYYNSSTARRITELIFGLEEIIDLGKNVKVIWCYKAGDVIMKENGEEIKSVVQLPFEIREVNAS
ncbi:MAG TPA: hypothetical protein DCX54_10035 [Flavobacteriales bacterium]|nr:hypothetical protein [Flavobacteriales bacterium]